jgi:hypothetical protein
MVKAVFAVLTYGASDEWLHRTLENVGKIRAASLRFVRGGFHLYNRGAPVNLAVRLLVLL